MNADIAEIGHGVNLRAAEYGVRWKCNVFAYAAN
jgi:hypothetical protein